MNKGSPFSSQSFASPAFQEFSQPTERCLDVVCARNVGFDQSGRDCFPLSQTTELPAVAAFALILSSAQFRTDFEGGVWNRRGQMCLRSEHASSERIHPDNGTQGPRPQGHRLTAPSQRKCSAVKLLSIPERSSQKVAIARRSVKPKKVCPRKKA